MCDVSPKVSNSSPLVSYSTTINVPRELNIIDVAATFGVSLTTVGDLHKLIKDIEAGKHDELLDDRMKTMDALVTLSFSLWTSISAKDQPKVNSNFRTLVADPVFYGVNIFIPRKNFEKVSTRFEHTLYGYFIGKRMAFSVVEYYARNNWVKHGLKRIMMNSKGFFFFKFDSRTGLEAVLEGGPWLIRKSPIILKKWSMDTRLLKEELTRILIWVKLHDVPIQVFEDDCISLIATFIGKPADLVDVVTIGIPSLSGDGFTKETIHVEYEWKPPRCDMCKIFGHVHDHCPKKVVNPPIVTPSNVVTPIVEKTNDGFQTVGKKKKRKGKSKSTNGGQLVGPSVKQNVRYEPKVTTSAANKGVTNVEEDVKNVYDESANLIQNTKAGGRSSFTAAAG
ncbi:zinc knuckle CX2CX4HX4C containing protein [Tanacetum coccineum]